MRGWYPPQGWLKEKPGLFSLEDLVERGFEGARAVTAAGAAKVQEFRAARALEQEQPLPLAQQVESATERQRREREEADARRRRADLERQYKTSKSWVCALESCRNCNAPGTFL